METDRRLPIAVIVQIIEDMGYRVTAQELHYFAFDKPDAEMNTIFIHLPPADEIPLADVEQLLENVGISLDVFYAFLESQ